MPKSVSKRKIYHMHKIFSPFLYLGYKLIYRLNDEHPYCWGFVFFGLGALWEYDLDSDSSILQSQDSFVINLQARSLVTNPGLVSIPTFPKLIPIQETWIVTPSLIRLGVELILEFPGHACPGPWPTKLTDEYQILYIWTHWFTLVRPLEHSQWFMYFSI